MQSVPAVSSAPRPEPPRSQELQPIADLGFSTDSRADLLQEMPHSGRFGRSGSLTQNYYGDASTSEVGQRHTERQTSDQSFNRSLNNAGDNKFSHQSRRLPYWIWFVLAKSLGIKLSPTDRPIFGTLMHSLTLLFALGFAITFIWHKVYDIRSENTPETVLKGAVAILMAVYWCAMGVYANKLASKLFRNPKFLDSVRLHTKTIFKISAAGMMVGLGITVVILHCVDTSDTYQLAYCHKVGISAVVCHVMYVMKVGCVWISLLWNLLVGIVLLSVCRTHTIGIRRFIRELEIDGKLYELRQRRRYATQHRQNRLQCEAVWDDGLNDPRDQWDDNTSTDDLDDPGLLDLELPASTLRRMPSRSAPTSPLPAARAPPRDGSGVASSYPRSHSQPAGDAYSLDSLPSDTLQSFGGGASGRRNPFNTGPPPGGRTLGDAAVRDHFAEDEFSSQPVNDVLLLDEDYYEKPPSVEPQLRLNEEEPEPEQKAESQNSKSNTDATDANGNATKENRALWKFLSVNDIYLSYWKISCRLRFTSIALQRWLLAVIMFIVIWAFTYIIYWVKHEATLMDICLFLIPILILPIICSAYGEVNYEGKRMLRCICPTGERTEMLQTLFQQPLELNAFGFAISYQVIGGALGALAVAFCTRLVLDEIG